MSKKSVNPDRGIYSGICMAIRQLNGNQDREIEKSKKLMKDLKANGQIEYFFNKYKLTENLEKLLDSFINIMEKPKLEQYKYYRKYCLYNFSSFVKCYLRYYYEFGVYFSDNKEINREEEKTFTNFPRFFKKVCMYYGKEPYASMEENELRIYLNEYVDLAGTKIISPNYNRSPNAPSFVKNAKIETYNKIGGNSFLAAHYGDGYGYDILRIRKNSKKEVLIQVKSCMNDHTFRLSRYEHKVMVEATKLPNSEYFIYKYNYGYDREKHADVVKSLNIYRYDSENNILVDINDENNICEIQAYMDYEREGRKSTWPRIRFKCIPTTRDKKELILK